MTDDVYVVNPEKPNKSLFQGIYSHKMYNFNN